MTITYAAFSISNKIESFYKITTKIGFTKLIKLYLKHSNIFLVGNHKKGILIITLTKQKGRTKSTIKRNVSVQKSN